MKPIEIIDAIYHKNKYSTQRFLVIDRNPEYLYEKKGNWLIGEDSGFFSFLIYKKCIHSKAFAGREFEIKMKDGSTIKANGQWWSDVPEDFNGLLYHLGCGTPEGLSSCNVFSSAKVDKDIVDSWLIGKEISNNYHKYDKNSSDFGKQTIISPF